MEEERINLHGAVNEALRKAGAERVATPVDDNADPDFIGYVWRDLPGEAQPGDTIVLSCAGPRQARTVEAAEPSATR